MLNYTIRSKKINTALQIVIRLHPVLITHTGLALGITFGQFGFALGITADSPQVGAAARNPARTCSA